MRIYWIGKDKPKDVPAGFRALGDNVFETHDSHAARELGGTDARWSLTRLPQQKTPPKNDPNRLLRAEQKAKADAEARAAARKAGLPEPAAETETTTATVEEDADDEGDGEE